MWEQFIVFEFPMIHPLMNENKIAYMESNKFSMLLDHEKNALCDSYIDESIHDATKNYYERGTYDS